MENLKVTILQPDIIWENPGANLEKYSEMVSDLESTDLIVLPEMFTTGFSMQPIILKEKMDGVTVNWMKKVAAEKDAAVTGSLIIEDGDNIFNRTVWVFPDGKIGKYDKRHLFTMGQEPLFYSAGNKKMIVEYKGWKFCPLICYDLRFPVWARNTENYDVLLYVANWPAPRHHHWKSLLVARAVENQSYCIGANRTGKDGNGLDHLGDSCLISPKGIAEFMGEKECIKTYEISYAELHDYRKNFPLLDDRDDFKIRIPSV
jgi:predicted amidohydrolase